MKLIFEMAIQHIKFNKKSRKIYSIIFFAICILLANFAGINAIKAVMTKSAKEVVTGDILVCNKEYNFSLLGSKTEKTEYAQDAAAFSENMLAFKNVQKVLQRINSTAVLAVNENTYNYISLIGLKSNEEELEIIKGSNIVNQNQILITQSLSNEMDIDVSDKVLLRVSNATKENSLLTCEVVGIYNNDRFGFMRSNHVLMELNDLQNILGKEDCVTHYMIYTDNISDVAFGNMIQEKYKDLKVMSSRESADLIYSIQDGMQVVMLSLVGIMMVISIVTIANLSLSYLRQQSREIAILKAMGFENIKIIGIYILESIIQSIILALSAAVISLVLVGILGNIGIPIGGGQKLFGDETLILSLKGIQVSGTCIITIFSAVFATFLSLKITLRRTQIAILQ